MGQNVLDQVVSVLVASNVDQRNPRTVMATFTDSVKVPTEEINPTDFQTLFNNFGGKLIHAVFGSISNNMINCPTAIGWCAMLTNVLNAPIAKLSVSDNVNACKHLLDTWTLNRGQCIPSLSVICVLTLSSSRQFSKMFWTTKLPVSPRATSCHIPRNASLTYFMIWGGDSVQRSSKSFCQTWQAYRWITVSGIRRRSSCTMIAL